MDSASVLYIFVTYGKQHILDKSSSRHLFLRASFHDYHPFCVMTTSRTFDDLLLSLAAYPTASLWVVGMLLVLNICHISCFCTPVVWQNQA